VIPELEDYVNSLVENHLHIEIQLLYGNPLYTSPAGRLPQSIQPAASATTQLTAASAIAVLSGIR